MTAAPKRRWLSFSLRTLFVVVTVVACWLGWNLYTVRERSRIAIAASEGGGGVVFQHESRSRRVVKKDIPWSWKLLGAEPALWVWIPSGMDEDLAYVRGIYPEAEVFLGVPVD